jgi:hydrogenase-4 component F
MMEAFLVLLPLAGAGLALAWRTGRTRPYLLPLIGVPHAVVAFALLLSPAWTDGNAWIGSDPLSRGALPMVSLLFLVCSFYSVAYLRVREDRDNRIFIAALLAMQGLLSLALQAQHLGLLWIAAEAATLATIPLLHFNGTARAFEATWKYLLIGGTGIALSLLGSFCLGYASLHGTGGGNLTFRALTDNASTFGTPWLVAAWVLLLAGFGTKMGLVPMHTWKPDAYGEAPGVVGVLLAGGVTTMAFVALLRVKQVVDAGGEAAMTERTLLLLGLFSMVVAALFLLGTPDFKRMLAYSSIEQMGVLAVGAAIGGAGLAAALFHVWTNGLTKGSLFLSAGNLRRAAGASTVSEVAGMAWQMPITSRLFVAGLLAITAIPPFGPFSSVTALVRAAFATGHPGAAAVFLSALLMSFIGLTRIVFGIVDGRPRVAARGGGARFAETRGILLPPLLFLLGSLWLGLAVPEPVRHQWDAAVLMLRPPS